MKKKEWGDSQKEKSVIHLHAGHPYMIIPPPLGNFLVPSHRTIPTPPPPYLLCTFTWQKAYLHSVSLSPPCLHSTSIIIMCGFFRPSNSLTLTAFCFSTPPISQSTSLCARRLQAGMKVWKQQGNAQEQLCLFPASQGFSSWFGRRLLHPRDWAILNCTLTDYGD